MTEREQLARLQLLNLLRTGEYRPLSTAERLGNTEAREGCDRCYCGCKYWERDRCIDCGTMIQECLRDSEWVALNRGGL